jgi:hypothetical protein
VGEPAGGSEAVFVAVDVAVVGNVEDAAVVGVIEDGIAREDGDGVVPV